MVEKGDISKLPDVPGVYLFKQGRRVLYVGKATSLRDRVRSYFDDDLIVTRGPRIVDMVTKADRIDFETTPTVLEALVREAALIRKYYPPANVDGKDDKTFLYAVITDEDIPRVLVVRGKDLQRVQGVSDKVQGNFLKPKTLPLTPDGTRIRAIYGPFPSGAQLREGLRLIRRIFPFFDTQKPVGEGGKHQKARVEFNQQIGQYPRAFEPAEYRRTIRKVMLFLAGRGKELRRKLEREMREAAAAERFEDAAEARRQLFALDHLQDVSLLKNDLFHTRRDRGEDGTRIEAYDAAHLSGTNAIGVMTVLEDGVPAKREYRTFRIRTAKNDDIASLKEVLRRRFGHPEWPYPRALVVDGGRTHKKAAEEVLGELGIGIPVAAVVKDGRHRPREVIGALRAGVVEADAVRANSEAHRFALRRHREARLRSLR